jgi:hypothetical protein
MKEAPGSSETSVLTIATRRNNPEDTILHSHCRKNLKSFFCEFKKYKSPSCDQILAELIQSGAETLQSVIHKFIVFGIRKMCLISKGSLLLYHLQEEQ